MLMPEGLFTMARRRPMRASSGRWRGSGFGPRRGSSGFRFLRGPGTVLRRWRLLLFLRLRMGRTVNNNQQAFFELLRAGLWEKETRLSPFEGVDYVRVHRLGFEQSVVGLIAAGLEHVADVKVPQEVALAFAGRALQLEQRNLAMNEFVAGLIEQLRAADVNALLVKGQGIAQCYERPLWRASGDVDLLLGDEDYEKAKELLITKATKVESEFSFMKHVGMTLNGWAVELHGTLHTRLSRRIDDEIDKVQAGVFLNSEDRAWHNGNTDVYSPAPDADVFFVFTHFLHHFFLEGLGLRQICDWCRLIWKYADEIDAGLLEKRLFEAGLMSEWRAFAALTVDWLGMPAEAMPLYCGDIRWSRKGDRILADVLRKGNFGRNERGCSGMQRAYLVRKFVSAGRHLGELLRHFFIFPCDSVGFFGGVLLTGVDSAWGGSRAIGDGTVWYYFLFIGPNQG